MGLNSPLNEDTIAALATPEGEGGIAVIRLTGPESFDILSRIFVNIHDGENPGPMNVRRLYHGRIVDPVSGEGVDEVLAVYMKSPGSYTGEDVVEIHSHGGLLVPRRILGIVFGLGVRPANPGEFSLRAFLNGRMDLAQAEAVADIVNAQTMDALKQAELQLEGALSDRIGKAKEAVLDILAEVEAQVDFPEEDIDPIVKDNITARIQDIIAGLGELIDSYGEGRILKYGVSTAIIGKPNVGKSSLLNSLLMKERAITSPIPGTTRDFIEESIDIRGLPLKLVDTAGIRATADEIERAGVLLAKKKADEAELIIAVIDGSSDLDQDDLEVLASLREKRSLVVINKSDIGIIVNNDKCFESIPKDRIIHTSAKTGVGMDALKDAVYTLLTGNEGRRDGREFLLTELRHKLALEKARDGLDSFLRTLGLGESPEFLALDLRLALDSLGEITGEVTTEDILGRIFSKFCVGK